MLHEIKHPDNVNDDADNPVSSQTYVRPHEEEIKEDAVAASQITFTSVQESLSSPIDRRSDYYRQRAREQQSQPQSQQSSKPQPLLTAPNVLTFMRLLLVPVLVVLWFLPHKSAPLASALTFIFAAITDWADGYLARRVSSPHFVQH